MEVALAERVAKNPVGDTPGHSPKSEQQLWLLVKVESEEDAFPAFEGETRE
jgi:hypothetical protein